MMSDSTRKLAMGGFAALTVAMAMASMRMPSPHPDTRTTEPGQTPRTARACEPLSCLAAGTDRQRVGFGSGLSRDADPAQPRDPAVRWATGEGAQ